MTDETTTAIERKRSKELPLSGVVQTVLGAILVGVIVNGLVSWRSVAVMESELSSLREEVRKAIEDGRSDRRRLDTELDQLRDRVTRLEAKQP